MENATEGETFRTALRGEAQARFVAAWRGVVVADWGAGAGVGGAEGAAGWGGGAGGGAGCVLCGC